MSVYLIRHPELADYAGICYGQLDCIPAASVMAQAIERVKDQIVESVLGQGSEPAEGGAVQGGTAPVKAPKVFVWSSPLRRCSLLAEGVWTALQATGRQTRTVIAPALSPLLQEMDFGAWEGISWNEVDRAAVDAWAADPWHYRPGGGECAHDVLARWHRFKKQHLMADATAIHLVITHAGVARLALWDSGQVDTQDLWLKRIAHAELIQLQVRP